MTRAAFADASCEPFPGAGAKPDGGRGPAPEPGPFLTNWGTTGPVIARRALLAGGGALATTACLSPPAANEDAPDRIYRGLELLSESVHCGVSSADGRHRLTLRLCRYPSMGRAWLWLHARTPDGFYSHVDHLAPCGNEATPASDISTRYADLAETLVFKRAGPLALPASAEVEARMRAHRTARSRFGPGPAKVAAAINFQPARAYSGLNPGRTEIFGLGWVRLETGGRAIEFDGPAQFHEQRQTTPRFMTPFAYITLWSEDAGSTLLVTPGRADGYLLEGRLSSEAKVLRLDPPGQARRILAVALADGRTLEGEARLTQAYSVPLYGSRWRGHFVEARLAGRIFRGNINDYLPERLPYPGQD